MPNYNVISSDLLSRLLDSLGCLITHCFPGPGCHGWSVLMISLWAPVKREVLQCQRERISAGETEAEMRVPFHKRDLSCWGRGGRKSFYLVLWPRDAGQCLDEVRTPLTVQRSQSGQNRRPGVSLALDQWFLECVFWLASSKSLEMC